MPSLQMNRTIMRFWILADKKIPQLRYKIGSIV